jgi:hypothetical protein
MVMRFSVNSLLGKESNVIKTQQQDNAALYLRLSRDDGGDAESNSIGNQRAILQRYIAEAGLNLIGEYIEAYILLRTIPASAA